MSLEGQVNDEDARSLAENIIQSVSNSTVVKVYSRMIGANIAVLTQKADKAMYTVKYSGRNNVAFAE